MGAVNRVLVIGGRFSGMAAAIRMQRAGIQVDLVEIDAEWCPLGAGITINGATLRALETLGLYDRFVELGRERPAATTHNLRDALNAVFAGRVVSPARTQAVGCFIADMVGGR